MPHQEQVTETYWCPGGWPWEWFDTCERTVTKWCYDFSWVEETGWGIASHLTACENGIEYTWWAFSFNIFGSEYFGPGTMCFDDLLEQSGVCQLGVVNVKLLAVTANAPRPQALSKRRIRLRQHHAKTEISRKGEKRGRPNEPEG
jgi:hypothetical protein